VDVGIDRCVFADAGTAIHHHPVAQRDFVADAAAGQRNVVAYDRVAGDTRTAKVGIRTNLGVITNGRVGQRGGSASDDGGAGEPRIIEQCIITDAGLVADGRGIGHGDPITDIGTRGYTHSRGIHTDRAALTDVNIAPYACVGTDVGSRTDAGCARNPDAGIPGGGTVRTTAGAGGKRHTVAMAAAIKNTPWLRFMNQLLYD